jgi:hypothetical protein
VNKAAGESVPLLPDKAEQNRSTLAAVLVSLLYWSGLSSVGNHYSQPDVGEGGRPVTIGTFIEVATTHLDAVSRAVDGR